MSKKKINIAIDGYSSCGKSTLAKEIAKKLSYLFIDTGAMYRAITYYFLKNNLFDKINSNEFDIKTELDNIDVQFVKKDNSNEYNILLNGDIINKEIREMNVSNSVSKIASIKEVRLKLVKLQQEIGKNGGVVMDGRDIGSVVFPNAEIKLFLTADPLIRAKRRWLEIGDEKIKLEDIIKNIEERDYLDTHREESPLIKVDDAIEIDNSNLNKEEQFDLIMKLIEKKLK